MMARFSAYVEKVFELGQAVKALTDSRQKPRIPSHAIFMSALLMFITRRGSLNGLENQLRVPGRWEKIIGASKPSADRVGQVVGLMPSERLRQMLSVINHRLRRNKNLDNNPWPLRFVALDGHEFFSLTQSLLQRLLPATGHCQRRTGH